MENSATIRESISAFADGEVSGATARQTLNTLREPSHSQTWDLYHQIGDTLRSESMAVPLSKDFSQRLAAKLDDEPSLLAPRHANRRIQGQIALEDQRKWFKVLPASLAAVAAAVLAFVMAPNFISDSDTGFQNTAGTFVSVTPSHGALLAEAIQTREPLTSADASYENHTDVSQYIEVHRSSHASLYGSARLAQPAALVTATEK